MMQARYNVYLQHASKDHVKRTARRSNCPINFALQTFGDAWSLLVIRDLMFTDRRTYTDFLNAEERMATNVLADRLEQLQAVGQDVGRHALFGVEKVRVGATVGEHQITNHQQAPGVAESLQGEIDRAVRTSGGAFHVILACMLQVYIVPCLHHTSLSAEDLLFGRQSWRQGSRVRSR